MKNRRFSLWGIVVALVGFVLTRFTVTFAVAETRLQFLFGGFVPLVLGLALAATGVVLAVGAYRTEFVRTVAVWCVLGTVTMVGLVVLTLLGSDPSALTDMSLLREQTILSNFLIAGAVGGTLTGMYAGRNRSQRLALEQQTNRLVLLNRLLRDRVINSATAIKGHTGVLQDTHRQQSIEAIDRQADSVVETVESIKYLLETTGTGNFSRGTVDLTTCVERAVADIRESYPGTTYRVQMPDGPVPVHANRALEELVRHLVENAVVYNDSETPLVEITVTNVRSSVTLTVSDNGPGLPSDQQVLLESGQIAEYDDPTTGFGLNIVRLLAETFDGEITTSVSSTGSDISIELPVNTPIRRTVGGPASTAGLTNTQLSIALIAGAVAGISMGLTMELFNDVVFVIGALYGIEDPLVGIVTHEFHSIVFALTYVSIVSTAPTRYSDRLLYRILFAVVFGLALWIFAAGLVMPLWLQLIGLGGLLPVPNLTAVSLLGHVVWGVTTSLVYAAGIQHMN